MDNSGLLFPECISYGSKGGPNFNTSVVTRKSGHEKRNINWSYPLHSYDVSYGVKIQSHMTMLLSFFHQHYGRGIGFLYKDYSDFEVETSDYLGSDTSYGILLETDTEGVFQLYKVYVYGNSVQYRKITRPRVVFLYDESSLTTGQVDLNTGLVIPDEVTTFSDFTWTGDFYVPVRFDQDKLDMEIINRHGDELMLQSSVNLVEIRE